MVVIRNNITVSYAILVLAAVIVYFNSLLNDFVFDDEAVILSDASITQIANIPKFFSGQEGFHKVIGKYYRPLVSASYAIDYAIWKYNPFGFHLTNILIHVINSILFFRFLLLLFEKIKLKGISKSFSYLPLFGALIFAIHPIHTEAVCWISGRTDSLAFTFFFASFIYYLIYFKGMPSSRKQLHFVLILLFYILAVLSKEMSLTLPFAFVLYDLIIKKLSFKQIRIERSKIYSLIFIISCLYLLVRWQVLKDVQVSESYFYFYAKDWSTSVFTMLQTIPLYLRLLIFPVGLLYHYNCYLPYVSTLFNINVIIAQFIILLLIVSFVFFLKKEPLISFSIIFFFATLLPVLNIVPTINLAAERFLYIPSVSICIIILVILNYSWFSRIKFAGSLIMVVILMIFGYLTFSRSEVWKNDETLYMSALGKPGTVIYVNIGNIYVKKNELDIGENYFRKAIELRDETPLAHNNLAKILMAKGKYDSAYFYIIKAFKLDTLSPEPRLTLAKLYSYKNMLPQAINEIEMLHKIVPAYLDSREFYSELKAKMRNSSDKNYTDSSKFAPDQIIQMEQDSKKKYQNKEYVNSIKELEELIKINPNSKATYYNNIGMCYTELSNFEEAKKNFEFAVEANEDFSTAYNNLGNVYVRMGDRKNAKDAFKKAIEIDPNNMSAKDNYDKLK